MLLLLLLFPLLAKAGLPEQVAFIKSTLKFNAAAIPSEAVNTALKYYEDHFYTLGNTDFLAIIDFTKLSNQKRLHLINMNTGQIENYLVAHGQGSGSKYSVPNYFTDAYNSEASSVGIYVTKNIEYSDHLKKDKLVLDGKDPTNNNAFGRGIVMHGAWYVSESEGFAGRSQGCPAVDDKLAPDIMRRLEGGSVIYIYGKGIIKN